jgi:hypothetical protein
MSRDAGNFVAAGAVGGAVMAKGMVGGAQAAGGVMNVVRNAVTAGDEGWDVDGNFVCSKFLFNFATRQVFDGSEVHDFDAIQGYTWQGGVFSINIKGRIKPKPVNVGMPERCQMLAKVFDDISSGVEYTPETKKLLPTLVKRVHRVKPGTVFRYAVRSFFTGIFLGIPITGSMGYDGGDPHFFAVLWFMAGVFALSVAWRKFKPVTAPVWRTAA